MKRFAFVLLALALGSACAVAAQVDPALMAQAAGGARVEALIVLPDQATPALVPFSVDADYKLRRRALVDALQARAASGQADLQRWLRAHQVEYRSYWIVNLLWARVSEADLAALAQRGDVARIEGNPRFAVPLPRTNPAMAVPAATAAVTWGIEKIRAPRLWAAGFTGQGVVIGGEDTGYQWNHPALLAHYRGWDGVAADHDYSWHDAIHDAAAGNPCGSDAVAPCDDEGHGTHTAGTFVGDDGADNQIGVAPGAQWIGCRNMEAGVGTPARYIECMQWMLAPTDLAGANADPDLAPDIVSNSWVCPPAEGCTVGNEIESAVDALVAGGIFFVAAAGNSGPACATIVDPPAIYSASFVVGATDSVDRLASFSSRGPVSGSVIVRPDLAAPGVNVRSAWNDGGYRAESGTSMATPHVAGAAALLMSVDPALKGHPDQVAQLLRDNAATAGVSDPYNLGCGGSSMSSWPNDQAGHGRLDVYAAAVAAGMPDTVFKDGFDGASAN